LQIVVKTRRESASESGCVIYFVGFGFILRYDSYEREHRKNTSTLGGIEHLSVSPDDGETCSRCVLRCFSLATIRLVSAALVTRHTNRCDAKRYDTMRPGTRRNRNRGNERRVAAGLELLPCCCCCCRALRVACCVRVC